jgi:type I restriction enzyme R subunit/putative DNA methylase
MVNHVHILIYPEADLSKITKSIKNFSARQANSILGTTGQPFWQEESYDHWVRGPEETEKIVRYIEENPVSAGLVGRVEDWRWSSAWGDRPGGPSYPSLSRTTVSRWYVCGNKSTSVIRSTR